MDQDGDMLEYTYYFDQSAEQSLMILRQISSPCPHEIVYDLSKVHVCTVDVPTEKMYQPQTSYFGLNIIAKKSRKVYF